MNSTELPKSAGRQMPDKSLFNGLVSGVQQPLAAAVMLALSSLAYSANDIPVTASAATTTPAAPKAKAETAPALTESAPLSAHHSEIPNSSGVNVEAVIANNWEELALAIHPGAKPVTGMVIALLFPNGQFYRYAANKPGTPGGSSSWQLWDGRTVQDVYDANVESVMEIPLISFANNQQTLQTALNGATLYVGTTNATKKSKIVPDMVEHTSYTEVAKFLSDSKVANTITDVIPGEQVTFTVNAKELAATLPAMIDSCIGGTCTIISANGSRRPGAGQMINSGERLEVQLPAGGASNERRAVTVSVNGNGQEFVAQTLEYTTKEAETLSNDKNNPTQFVAVSLTLPEGATEVTLTQGLAQGIVSAEYKAGKVIRTEKNPITNQFDKGTHCRLSYMLNGQLVKKYFDVLPK